MRSGAPDSETTSSPQLPCRPLRSWRNQFRQHPRDGAVERRAARGGQQHGHQRPEIGFVRLGNPGAGAGLRIPGERDDRRPLSYRSRISEGLRVISTLSVPPVGP